jgi:hypothetical protein
MGEGLSRDLPGQVECCGLGSRERVSRYVDDTNTKVKGGMDTHKETSVRGVVWVHEKRFILDDDTGL